MSAPAGDVQFFGLHTTTSGQSSGRESSSFDEPRIRDDNEHEGRRALAGSPAVPSSSASSRPPSSASATLDPIPVHFANLLTRTTSAPTSTPTPSTSRQPLPLSRSPLSNNFIATRPRAPTASSTPSSQSLPLAKPTPLLFGRPSSPPATSFGPTALQSHLYVQGLLGGALSDAHFLAFGRRYKLHRLILVQSGFFASLLSGGFSEERRGPVPIRRGGDGDDVARSEDAIELSMEPPLGRAAFELCLSRMYGNGPVLIPPPWARTTPDAPLSNLFQRVAHRVANPNAAVSTNDATMEEWSDFDGTANVHPATPEFLLSLLASATYLELPSVQVEALKLIHTTITPWTVGKYLG